MVFTLPAGKMSLEVRKITLEQRPWTQFDTISNQTHITEMLEPLKPILPGLFFWDTLTETLADSNTFWTRSKKKKKNKQEVKKIYSESKLLTCKHKCHSFTLKGLIYAGISFRDFREFSYNLQNQNPHKNVEHIELTRNIPKRCKFLIDNAKVQKNPLL